jgi:chromosome segregation ATPase
MDLDRKEHYQMARWEQIARDVIVRREPEEGALEELAKAVLYLFYLEEQIQKARKERDEAQEAKVKALGLLGEVEQLMKDIEKGTADLRDDIESVQHWLGQSDTLL